MTLSDLVGRTAAPVTGAQLRAELGALGIGPGDLLMVHASLSALGWVSGGAQAVVEALLAAVGPGGTLVMPAQSADNTDPMHWSAPPVPDAWWPVIRETMPAYDPRTTPTRAMGRIAELFRTWPGTLRSAHPSCSFAALGPLAADILGDHPLEDPLGAGSPLGALHARDAKVLLIGVGFDRCTMLHLAEDLAFPDREMQDEGASVLVDGDRRWVRFRVPRLMDSDAFLPVGAAAEADGIAAIGLLGSAPAVLVRAQPLVGLAVRRWRGDGRG